MDACCSKLSQDIVNTESKTDVFYKANEIKSTTEAKYYFAKLLLI